MADYVINVLVNGVEQSVSTIGQLEGAIQATNAELNSISQTTNEFQTLNQQADLLSSTFGEVATNSQQLQTNLDGVTNTTSQLNSSLIETANLVDGIDGANTTTTLGGNLEKVVGKSQSLRTELRKVTIELQGLEVGSKRFQELSLRAGQLRDEISDTGQIIGSLAGTSTERFGKALNNTVNVGVLGFSALTQAAQLFGAEGTALEPILQKLQILLTITASIQAFGGLGDTIDQIKAGFKSLTANVEENTVATATNAVAADAQAVAQEAQTAATNASNLATNASAAANAKDAASSITDAAAKGAEAVATTGVATATGAATIATRGFSLALKALPIIGVVAAVASLAYGLYEYFSASEQANKEEEKRKKILEEKQKAEQAQGDFIAKEGAALIVLIAKLRASQPLTKERVKLIKDINGQYGTTLKNLKDEDLFTKQLTLTVQKYIAYLRLKYKATQEQQKLDKSIAEEEKIQIRIGAANAELKKLEAQMAKMPLPETYLDAQEYNKFSNKITMARANLVDLNNALINQQKTTEKVADGFIKMETEIEKMFKVQDKGSKSGGSIDKLTNSVDKLSAAEEFLLQVQEERLQVINEAELQRVKSTRTLIDDLEFQKKSELDNIESTYKAALKKNEGEVKDKKKRNIEKKKIDTEYQKFLEEIDTRYKKLIEEQKVKEVATNEKAVADLKQQYEILQKEILFGDQNTADTRERFALEDKAQKLESLNQDLQNNQLSLEDLKKKYKDRTEALKDFLQLQQKLELENLDAIRTRDLANYKKLLTDQNLLTIDIKQEQIDQLDKFDEKTGKSNLRKVEAETEEEYQIRLRAALKSAGLINEQTDEINILSLINLIKTKQNLDDQYLRTKQKLEKQTQDAINQSNLEGTEQTSKKQLEILQASFATTINAIAAVGTDLYAGYSQLITESLTLTEQFLQLSKTKFETTADKVQAYALVIGQSLSSLISAFQQQNQANLDKDLENLERNASASQRILDERYAANLISKEEYDRMSLKLDNDLEVETDKKREEAFERDKKLKISQTIVAGLTGAVSAFAGSMQLGPIIGPIVGGVLAAAVLSMSALTVANISKQKYNSRGGNLSTGQTSANMSTASSNLQSQGGGFTSFSQSALGTPGQTTEAQTTSTTGSQMSQRVYVVESDITNAQRRVQVLEGQSTFS